MRTITKEFSWDMAHRLPNHKGKCFNVHGHTYKALITIVSDFLQEDNAEDWMIIDFWNLKEIKNRIDENRDHCYLGRSDDEVLKFLQEKNFKTFEFESSPTAEKMAEFLFDKVSEFLPKHLKVEKVTVYETPTNYATFTENEDLPF